MDDFVQYQGGQFIVIRDANPPFDTELGDAFNSSIYIELVDWIWTPIWIRCREIVDERLL